MKDRCENCGADAPGLHLCPCGLGDACPITVGVCARCRRMIERNAVDRRREARA